MKKRKKKKTSPLPGKKQRRKGPVLARPNPGTNQASLFNTLLPRLKKARFKVYGLSADSGKANASFASKLSLDYPLLSDPDRHLISALELTKGKQPRRSGGATSAATGTERGVVAIKRDGTFLLHFKGSPKDTVEAAAGIDGVPSAA